MFAGNRMNVLTFAVSLFLMLVPLVPAHSTPDFVCGDADGNGIANISDAVWLVAYIFGGGPAPDPLESGDCDLNGIVNISDAAYLVAFIFCSGPEPCSVPEGTLVSWFGCKSWSKSAPPDSAAPDQDCLYWEYDGQSVLDLLHMNTGANCCPEEITGEITIQGFEITIVEDEILEAPCDCLCLFDVSYEIEGLSPGEYTITILGLYLRDMDPLQVTIDLAANSSGYFCLERTEYPWGVY